MTRPGLCRASAINYFPCTSIHFPSSMQQGQGAKARLDCPSGEPSPPSPSLDLPARCRICIAMHVRAPQRRRFCIYAAAEPGDRTASVRFPWSSVAALRGRSGVTLSLENAAFFVFASPAGWAALLSALCPQTVNLWSKGPGRGRGAGEGEGPAQKKKKNPECPASLPDVRGLDPSVRLEGRFRTFYGPLKRTKNSRMETFWGLSVHRGEITVNFWSVRSRVFKFEFLENFLDFLQKI